MTSAQSLPDGFAHHARFLDGGNSEALFKELEGAVPWQQYEGTAYGRRPQPRLTAYYGNAGDPYKYSGVVLHPLPWLPSLWRLKTLVEIEVGVALTRALLFLYRYGKDSVSWHADKFTGDQQHVVATVSLGASRVLQLRPLGTTRIAHKVALDSGDLFVMRGGAAEEWEHQIPKIEGRAVEPRIVVSLRSGVY